MSGLTRPIIILLAGLLVAALLVVPVASPPGSTARALEVTGPLSVVRSAPPDMSAGCPPWFPASFIGLVINSSASRVGPVNHTSVGAEANLLAARLCVDPLFQAQVKQWGNTSLGLAWNGQIVLVEFEISFNLPTNQTGVQEYWTGNTSTGVLSGPFLEWELSWTSSPAVTK